LRLAPLPRLFGPLVAFRADFSERQMDGNVPVHVLASPKIQASFEDLHFKKGVLRLGLPKADHNVCMEPTHVAGLRIEAATLALPVVFSRRRNAVAVVTAPDHVSALQGCQGLAHFRKTRVCGDSGMQACRDVLGGAMNAAYVLQE